MQTGRTGRVAALLTLSLMVGGVAFAQRGQTFFVYHGGVNWVRHPEAQAELKLRDAQKAEINQMFEKREQLPVSLQELRDATDEKRQQLLAAAQIERNRQLNTILNPDQQKRFKEISLQRQGLSALVRPDVADELKLTADQRNKSQEIVQQQQPAMIDAVFLEVDRDAAREKITAMQKDADTRIAALLTDEQKSRGKTMLGTPVSYPRGAR